MNARYSCRLKTENINTMNLRIKCFLFIKASAAFSRRDQVRGEGFASSSDLVKHLAVTLVTVAKKVIFYEKIHV